MGRDKTKNECLSNSRISSLFLQCGDATVSVCLSVCTITFRSLLRAVRDHMEWNTSKIISPPNIDCNVEILVQSSADFALTQAYNFQGTHRVGASRGQSS